GISPALEEAAQTLRASPMRTFGTITLPLMAPGFANAFLIVFIESLADFGNPLLLGGNLEVLSTAIYFAVVGVQQDPGRASVLAVILLAFSLGLFLVQRRLLSRRSFVTVGGKGDGGLRTPLPRSVVAVAASLALPWAALAVLIYIMIFTGGFFEKWGLNHALTLRHYVTAFGVAVDNGRLFWTGGARPYRSHPRRGVRDAASRQPDDSPTRHPAADPSRSGGGAGRQLHQRHDFDLRRNLPHQPALRHGDREHRRPRRSR